MCLPILFKSRTNTRVFFASNLCGVMNLTQETESPYKPPYKSRRGIQEKDSIAGTQGFPIKVSLYIDKHKQAIAKWWGCMGNEFWSIIVLHALHC